MVAFTRRSRTFVSSTPVAVRLDSKARLVLPLKVREKLSASPGDVLLFQISFDEQSAVFKVTKLPANQTPTQRAGQLRRVSRNGWE